MSKNIIVFCDGTNQKGGVGNNTNVYKLFNMIEDRTSKQIAYYDPGIGTDIKKITGSLFGRGFSKNILECYRFIFENFEAGDKIYLFGFSRGAATVRSLSSFIHLFGVLPKSRVDLIKEAFSIYKKSNREKKAKKFIQKHHTMWCSIEFVGVWDTVAALGFPVKGLSILFETIFSHKFHSFKLSKSIKFARHALSIDDERKTFHPILWEPINSDSDQDKLKQVWFAGVHTDVGGGYKEDELSDISLKWMIKEAVSKGLIIFNKSKNYKNLMGRVPNAEGMIHNEQKGFIGKMFKRKQRTWNNETHGKPIIHESVLKRTKSSDNKDSPEYKPWILNHMDQNHPKIES
ncbi:MAG: peptidoglycan-binding protein [Lutibacter sp.]|nr:MAG: peptidoglycan-binding protein [Lutibacter sp.]